MVTSWEEGRESRRDNDTNPNLAISEHPRVTSEDMAFMPRPRPSHMPAASAMTFLMAPPSSTPLTSRLV